MSETQAITDLPPGLHPNIPEDVYHALPYCSQSRLKVLGTRSPLHCYQDMIAPSKPTDAMSLGTMFHDRFLRPDVFGQKYAIGGQCVADVKSTGKRCANDGKIRHRGTDWLCGVHSKGVEADDITVLPASMVDSIETMFNNILNQQYIAGMIEAPQEDRELSAVWLDTSTQCKPDGDGTGLMCKARFDIYSRKTKSIIDIKTCQDASPAAFAKSVASYGYHYQAAFYLDGAASLGLDVNHFIFIAVESAAPHAVAAYRINPEHVDRASEVLQANKETFAWCLLADRDLDGDAKAIAWPGYEDKINPLAVPGWELKQIDDKIGRLAE